MKQIFNLNQILLNRACEISFSIYKIAKTGVLSFFKLAEFVFKKF